MSNFADPQTYIGVATGVVTVATGAVTVVAGWAKVRAERAYLDRVDKLCASLDGAPPHRDASLGERYKWTESLREFDEMTLPRPNVIAALLGTIFMFICVWMSAMLVVVVFVAGGAATWPQRLGVSVSAILFLLYAAVAWTFVDDFASHRYRLGRKRLDRKSPHLEGIRRLRRDFGVAGRPDQLADRQIRKARERTRVVKRFGIRMRRRARWPWIPTARTRQAQRVVRHAAERDSREKAQSDSQKPSSHDSSGAEEAATAA